MPPSWRIKQTITKWWVFIKDPDFTNPAIAIATIVIAAATVLTYVEVRGGSNQTNRIIAADERIAAAMERTIGQAQQSLSATIEQSRLEQRAWVGITIVEIPKPLPVGQTFEIVNHFLNTGKTPALRARSVSEIEVDVPNKQPNYKETDATEGPPLLPGAELKGTVTLPAMSDEVLKSLKSGKLVMYDRGAVWYWDVFGRKHTSTFCLAYNRLSGAFHADSSIPCKKQEAD